MSYMIRESRLTGPERSGRRLREARLALKPPPRLNLVEWADHYRVVASKNSASPGRWRTKAQPVAYGPMLAVTEPDTHTVTVMAGTQVVKTELLINVAGYFIHQDPSSILFVQPTQGAAESFSKERFSPTVESTQALRDLIAAPRSRDSENTITHKDYRGGALDFVGANSPTDLASRPKRIILCDEIDKYPPSAGSEGDPLVLAEERASTFKHVGRAKFVRTCSPTTEDESRIGREYAASDRRKCFVTCPHCGTAQMLSWANVVWKKTLSSGAQTYDIADGDSVVEHHPESAAIRCLAPECGVVWTERERVSVLDDLERASDHGWRQTREFVCCGAKHVPSIWDDKGRALCPKCNGRAPYGGHAGFLISKLYSKRHNLADIAKEFLEARGNPELQKKFTNTALAELWTPAGREKLDGSRLIERAEPYGPNDLPNEVKVITGFCDVQGDRLEVQLIGWGADEEAWPFLYEVINLDPAQPAAWKELDALHRRQFRNRAGQILRIAAFGVDVNGQQHDAQAFAFCRRRRGRRIFGTMGRAGALPVWPIRFSRTKANEKYWVIGADAAKSAIYARLKIEKPGPGYIHFPDADGFGPEYFSQLTIERREIRKRMGRPYTVWVNPPGKRNEALDTFVGALAVRRSLPRHIEAGLEFSVAPNDTPLPASPEREIETADLPAAKLATQSAPPAPTSRGSWLDVGNNWL